MFNENYKMLTETITTHEARPSTDILLVDRPFAKWTVSGGWIDSALYEVTVSIELAPGWKVTSSSRPNPGLKRNPNSPIIAVSDLEPFGPLSESGRCRLGVTGLVCTSWLMVRFAQAFRISSSLTQVTGNITVACEKEDGTTLMIKDDFILYVILINKDSHSCF